MPIVEVADTYSRWVRLLFGREFDFDDVLRVWDLLFAESISLGLIDMTCVAMLLRIRWDLIEADYSTAFTLLLRYSLPRSSPDKPVSLVRDAFYLDQNRTSQAGAGLVSHYSGRRPGAELKKDSQESSTSADFGLRRPSVPGSQNHNRPVPRQYPARFLPQQKNLESLFQEVSGTIQKRTEGWNLSKTIQGAVSEVKRNMNNSLATPPQRSTTTLIANSLAAEGDDGEAGKGALVKRIHDLEERNRALAKMLDSALDSLRSIIFSEPEAKSVAEDTFNISLAKIQFVSVYLSDPEIPIPSEEPTTTRTAVVKHTEGEQIETKTSESVLLPEKEKPAGESSKAVIQPKKSSAPPARQPLTQVTPQQKLRRQLRPTLAESSFSFMLGEDQHRSGFVSSVADLPEQARIEQVREAEAKSRPKQMAAESKKEQQRERRGSESEDDGFTMTSLRGARKIG